jgi:hypothetical protein
MYMALVYRSDLCKIALPVNMLLIMLLYYMVAEIELVIQYSTVLELANLKS